MRPRLDGPKTALPSELDTDTASSLAVAHAETASDSEFLAAAQEVLVEDADGRRTNRIMAGEITKIAGHTKPVAAGEHRVLNRHRDGYALVGPVNALVGCVDPLICRADC